MAKFAAKGPRVHLDHFIRRQSLRYQALVAEDSPIDPFDGRPDPSIRFDDIKEGWFTSLRKPDFQRATCAWDTEDCVKFLDSVVHRRIIPSIILWRSKETGQVYVLDGAHRLSVLRAWMVDDWGDRAANDFYAHCENYEEIITTAQTTRRCVGERIGHFQEFCAALKEWDEVADRGGAPKVDLPETLAARAQFLRAMTRANRTLHAQWEEGDYAAAEASFLDINRQGAPLDPTEQLLIEYRKGGICRTIMSIANDGAAGHYWPMPAPSLNLAGEASSKLSKFSKRCGDISKALFIPPFDAKIVDINVPLVVTSADSRRHQNLIEIVPLLSERHPVDEEKYVQMMERSITDDVGELIAETDSLLTRIETSISHFTDRSHGSTTLSVAPLIYWYNKKGGYVRGLFYGWCYWLLRGDEDQIRERKIAFSSVRGRLERILIDYKDPFAQIQHNAGAGFKSAIPISDTIEKLVEMLLAKAADSDDQVDAEAIRILGGPGKGAENGSGKSRAFSRGIRSEINVRALLGSAIRCEICDGVVDLKQGVQYDHKHEYASGGLSLPSNGRPTHPFCNLFRARIEKIRRGESNIALPTIAVPAEPVHPKPPAQDRLVSLFDAFPEEMAKITT
ncbi:DUF262 domain-containing protein [Geothrix sp. 21YS21S-2]|uniref:GmrSD restriction endonuclease domain-containing protein n=1 Tax=Geothrix sp. 21YS21S-2 TaxID=3068893 RepID=UPI0027B965EF|nr:DUF262 domain-containing protein [Geothrix sp. 21YS21S-2]